MKYEKISKISIQEHPQLDEKWVQNRIAEDPKILGLGDIILKDRERPQPNAAGVDLIYNSRWGRYRIHLGKEDVKKHESLLREMIAQAYRESGDSES